MKIEQLKRIFDFLEEKEEQNPPFMWKLRNDIPLREEELYIKGILDLTHTNIKSLPKGLIVEGHLFLMGSKITSLPEGLKVGGDLSLRGSKITSLPEGLKVGGYLNISKTTISLLPKGLEVGYFLNIRGTQLQKYSDAELIEMIKPGVIGGQIWRD
jgi:hypothetical protein